MGANAMSDLPEGFVLDSQPKAQAKKRDQSFLEGMALGAKKRALGIAELGANAAQALGADVSNAKTLIADVGEQYAREGTGTGVKGLVSEIAGDPFSYIPVASFAKLLGQGALMGATAPTGQEDSNLASNVVNAAGGLATSALGAGAGKVISKVAKPINNQLSEVGKAGIRKLEQAGIPLSAAQKTGSKALASLEATFSNLPMTAGAQNKAFEKQREAFTQAALKEAGVNVPDAGRASLEKAATALGNEYAALTKNNNLNIDEQLLAKIADIDEIATSGRLGQDAANLVKSVAADIYNSGNKISGEVYQKTRSLLTQKANSTKDSFDAALMKQLRGELDSAFERSLPQAQKGVMANINKRYESFKAIKDSMETLGGASGNIAPSTLYQKVRTGSKLSDLADAGQNILNQRIPDSGTAQRLFMQNALTGGGVGGATYLATQDPEKAALAAGLALGLPKAAQMLYSSGRGQKYLSEGMRPAIQTGANAVARALPAGVASGVTLNKAQGNIPEQPVIDELPEGFIVDEQNIAPQSSNQNFFDAVKMAESSGNPNAQAATSSASGLYQFTDQTWKDSVSKWGNKYGITEADKNNPQAQELMVRELTLDNARILADKIGREPSDGDLYMAHVFGAGAGAKMINNLGTNKVAYMLARPADVKANKSIFFKNGQASQPRTVDEVYALLTSKVSS
jgi:hypothetical protein